MLASRSSNDPKPHVERLAGRGGQPIAQGVLVGVEESASGMADDDDLVGPEQLLADDQRPDDVLGGEPAGVPDDVGFPGPQPEGRLDVEPRVHAGDDRQAAERGGRQGRAVERLGVAVVLGQQPVELPVFGHGRVRSVAGAEQERQPAVERGGRRAAHRPAVPAEPGASGGRLGALAPSVNAISLGPPRP